VLRVFDERCGPHQVDWAGSEALGVEGDVVDKYHVLIALMLSSQTKLCTPPMTSLNLASHGYLLFCYAAPRHPRLAGTRLWQTQCTSSRPAG